MITFMVGQISIFDMEEYKKYVNRFMPILEKYRGKLVAIGDHCEVLEGVWSGTRTVIVKFETREQARQWYQSTEYREIKEIRDGASNANVVLFESII